MSKNLFSSTSAPKKNKRSLFSRSPKIPNSLFDMSPPKKNKRSLFSMSPSKIPNLFSSTSPPKKNKRSLFSSSPSKIPNLFSSTSPPKITNRLSGISLPKITNRLSGISIPKITNPVSGIFTSKKKIITKPIKKCLYNFCILESDQSNFFTEQYLNKLNDYINALSKMVKTNSIIQQNLHKNRLIKYYIVPISYLLYSYAYIKYQKERFFKEIFFQNKLNYDMQVNYVYNYKNPVIKKVNVYFYKKYENLKSSGIFELDEQSKMILKDGKITNLFINELNNYNKILVYDTNIDNIKQLQNIIDKLINNYNLFIENMNKIKNILKNNNVYEKINKENINKIKNILKNISINDNLELILSKYSYEKNPNNFNTYKNDYNASLSIFKDISNNIFQINRILLNIFNNNNKINNKNNDQMNNIYNVYDLNNNVIILLYNKIKKYYDDFKNFNDKNENIKKINNQIIQQLNNKNKIVKNYYNTLELIILNTVTNKKIVNYDKQIKNIVAELDNLINSIVTNISSILNIKDPLNNGYKYLYKALSYYLKIELKCLSIYKKKKLNTSYPENIENISEIDNYKLSFDKEYREKFIEKKDYYKFLENIKKEYEYKKNEINYELENLKKKLETNVTNRNIDVYRRDIEKYKNKLIDHNFIIKIIDEKLIEISNLETNKRYSENEILKYILSKLKNELYRKISNSSNLQEIYTSNTLDKLKNILTILKDSFFYNIKELEKNIQDLNNKIFQIQYFKENIKNKIERLEQDNKNYNYYLDEIKKLEENISKNVKTINNNNKTSSFFIDLKKDLLNIYVYVDNIEYGLSKNKLHYLYNKDGIQNIFNRKEFKQFDQKSIEDFKDKLINYFSKINKNNFLENFLNNNQNIYPTNVKLFLDDFIKNSNDLTLKIKGLLKNILKNNVQFDPNTKLLNQFYSKILNPKLIKKENIINNNNNIKSSKILNPKLINNIPINSNLSKKLDYQLVLPYTDTLLLYLIDLNIFIDIITYFYK